MINSLTTSLVGIVFSFVDYKRKDFACFFDDSIKFQYSALRIFILLFKRTHSVGLFYELPSINIFSNMRELLLVMNKCNFLIVMEQQAVA